MTEQTVTNNENQGSADIGTSYLAQIKKTLATNVGFDSLPKADKIKSQKEENELLGAIHDGQRATLRHKIFKIALVSVSIMIGIVISVRFIHLIIPKCWYWLDDPQITLIDTFFVSAFVGGFVAKNITKVFGLAEN